MVNASGTEVVTYECDPYGKVLAVGGTMASTLGEANPLRYRGYCYDSETGLYYLQSRYYDPELGRFINADSYASTGQGILGNNMFAYCMNNPILFIDNSGYIPRCGNAWFYEEIIKPIEEFFSDIKEDCENYNADNDDVNEVYDANYFSSYKGTLVIRHSDEYLTSWAVGGTIFLNHNVKNDQENVLKHEYGHILQENELGTARYLKVVFIPSALYNAASRDNYWLRSNYRSMPWEYDASQRGDVSWDFSPWASIVSELYFFFTSNL